MRRRFLLVAAAVSGAVAVVLAITLSGRDVSSWPIVGWERANPAAAEPHDHHHDHDDTAKENKITLSDAQTFDRLVEELATKAAHSDRNRPPPSLSAVFARFAIPPEDQATIEATFAIMHRLHHEGRCPACTLGRPPGR